MLTDSVLWFWLIGSLLTASLVALDARKTRIPTTGDQYTLTTGALVWFVGCFLIIWAVLPFYLYRRSSILRWRTQRLTWDEGTNTCEDYVVQKEQDRILIWKPWRWGSVEIVVVGNLFVCGLTGIAMLASAIIDLFQGGAQATPLLLASLFFGVPAVVCYLVARLMLTNSRAPWIFDRQQGLLLKGDTPLFSLSRISNLDLIEATFRGNKSWVISFALAPDTAVKKRWWHKVESNDFFEFQSEVTARAFISELVVFLDDGWV